MDQATGRCYDDLRTIAGLDAADINLASMPKATVAQWRDGAAEPDVKTRLLLSDLHAIVARLQEFYTAKEIRVWLYARHAQLEGRQAIDEIAEGRSEDVVRIRDRLDGEAFP